LPALAVPGEPPNRDNGQAPAVSRLAQPPGGLGERPALRHVFHRLDFERDVAQLSRHQRLGWPGAYDDGLDEDAAWAAEREWNTEGLLTGFSTVRAAELTL
jgi:hypothetical protein